MKKLLFLLFAFITINLNATVLSDITKTANNAIDSTKLAVKEGITLVDTSSNFKMIYTDVKEGLTGLAQGLKVGVEHVYIVLVKQQVVNSVVWLIYVILLIPIGIVLYKFGVKLINYCENENPAPIFYCVFLGGGYIALVLLGLFHTDVIVSGFLNPEYGAIKDIINFVQNTSNTCSTCK